MNIWCYNIPLTTGCCYTSDSLLAYDRLKRSYSFFSENPFVQVKAGKENYIKFPLVQIDEEVDK
jgi:hypothetical protein